MLEQARAELARATGSLWSEVASYYIRESLDGVKKLFA